VIELAGRTFRRKDTDRWQMDGGDWPDYDMNITFDDTERCVWGWRVLAAALNEIERLTPENVESPDRPVSDGAT
jgi:hypothetical protein